METIDVAFEMPLDILDGINQGLLFRRGGVIVDGNSRVIMWLKQIPVEQIKKTSSILVQGTSIGTVSLATISFLYLQHNFIKINDKLDEINISLDAQNLSKLHSGFKLASEADLMTNKQHAKNQIIGARSLIEEGSNTFQHILNTLKPKTKNYTEKKVVFNRMYSTG
ncbi:hypothetical protein [Planococcus koreensis]|uniref:hypothetical protein n=1 Tax=Planococcus koreensis TaxID=112331 RepID=UPI0039FBEF18